jgi:17beta-estradiol 17-dehydrogenase / very-long-chain 3-oxoacyl-CoA reductase
MLNYLFFVIGLLNLLDLFLVLCQFIKAQRGKLNLSKYQGSWALITASTDGLGLGFAEECAKSGMNIILVARNAEKMNSVASNLKSLYGINVASVQFDFGASLKNPIASYSRIYDSVSNLDISLIVNNIGISTKHIFDNTDTAKLQNSLNLWPIIFITRIFMHKLVSRPKGSGIINISSVGSYQSLALKGLTVYASGKAFGAEFSRILSMEAPTGMDVLCLTPGWIDTPMSRASGKDRDFLVSKNECARAALEQLGFLNKNFGHNTHWKTYCYYSMFVALANARWAILRPFYSE